MERFDWGTLPVEQLEAMVRAVRRWYPGDDTPEAIGELCARLLREGKLAPPAGPVKPYVSLITPNGLFLGIEPDGYTHS